MMRIARHELTRHAGFLDRRVLIIAGIVALLAVPLAPILGAGVASDAGLYAVRFDGPSPFSEVVDAHRAFRLVAGDADLVIQGEGVVAEGPLGDAAYEELRRATRIWMRERLAEEPDQAAAFPVEVAVIFRPRAGDAAAPPEGRPALQDVVEATPQERRAVAPDDVSPPFPGRSLILTFAYVIPLNFLGQMFAGALLHERTRDRGLVLLTAPVRPSAILWGRSLPYLGAAAAIGLATTLALQAGWRAALAASVVGAVAMLGSQVVGLTARSQRDMTFLLVGFTTMFSTFLFMPAMFTSIPPVAYLSPMTVIAAGIEGTSVPWAAFAYATAPLAIAAAGLAVIATSLYREETLFSPRALGGKVLDGMGRIAAKRKGLFALGFFAVPFTIGFEMFVIGLAIVLRLDIALVVFLVATALIEEVAKALPLWRPRKYGILVTSLLIGTGFWLAEKAVLAVGLLGFSLLPEGTATLASFGVATSPLLVLAPLVLHSATVAIQASLVTRSRGLAVVVATGVHAAYNMLLLRGLP